MHRIMKLPSELAEFLRAAALKDRGVTLDDDALNVLGLRLLQMVTLLRRIRARLDRSCGRALDSFDNKREHESLA